jgi:hypothetical protein
MSPALTATVSLGGVLIGAALSFFGVWLAQITENRRQVARLIESRRTERVAHLIAFLDAAQAVERVAIDRHNKKLNDQQWRDKADVTLDSMWTRQRATAMLCTPEVSQAAHDLAWVLHEAVRHGPRDQQVHEFVRPQRRAFLVAAHEDLGSPNTNGQSEVAPLPTAIE